MRRILWPLMMVLTVITACGSLSSSGPVPRAALPKLPTATVASARFATAAGSPPIAQVSGAGGTPIAVVSTSREVGFVLEQADSESRAGGVVLRTDNGGASWTTLPLPSRLVYEGIDAPSAAEVVVWGETPACLNVESTCTAEVLQSHDGGSHFSVVLRARDVTWTAPAPWASGLWLAATTANCFGSCTPVSVLYTAATSGTHWTKVASGPHIPNFTALWTNNGSLAYGLGSHSVYESEDGGASWTRLATLPAATDAATFAAFQGTIAVPAPNVLDISACNGAALSNAGCPVSVFQSQNGGRSFRDVLNWGGTQAGALHMPTPETGTVVMVGTTGGNTLPGPPTTNLVVSTQDAFATTAIASELPISANAVSFRSPKDGWVVGPGGGILPGHHPADQSERGGMACGQSYSQRRVRGWLQYGGGRTADCAGGLRRSGRLRISHHQRRRQLDPSG